MTYEEFLRQQGIGPKEQSNLNPDRRERLRSAWSSTTSAPAPVAPSPYTAPTASGGGGEPSVGWGTEDTTQNWVNENPYEFMQGKLLGSGLVSPTGGTSFDTWLTNSYLPRLMGGYYQNMTKDASGNLTKSGIDPAQARRMFLHRPDAERMPNPFAAGPGRWSMWD
jgi:hypothetical protein